MAEIKSTVPQSGAGAEGATPAVGSASDSSAQQESNTQVGAFDDMASPGSLMSKAVDINPLS